MNIGYNQSQGMCSTTLDQTILKVLLEGQVLYIYCSNLDFEK